MLWVFGLVFVFRLCVDEFGLAIWLVWLALACFAIWLAVCVRGVWMKLIRALLADLSTLSV